jgi:hypothetical protein
MPLLLATERRVRQVQLAACAADAAAPSVDGRNLLNGSPPSCSHCRWTAALGHGNAMMFDVGVSAAGGL